MEVGASFGAWIRQRRSALHLTQAELAACACCSLPTIRKIESDQRRPSAQIAELLASCLQIPPGDRPAFLKVARGELRLDRLNVTPAAPATPMVGREAELAALSLYLRDPACRLVTITGPGGVGKSRLALQLAESTRHAFEDGAHFAPLAALGAPDYLVPAIAHALALGLYGSVEPRVQLLSYLREKHLLLVLDNLEHLLAGVVLLAEVLEAAPGVKLLATSRERLGLPGEWVFRLQGLPAASEYRTETPDGSSAGRLFVQCGRRARADFQVMPDDEVWVGRICRAVEGSPLAIELAAAWVSTLSCREIAEEIERNLDFLAAQRRGVPERQRSLRAAFDYSWNLLSPDEQRILARLSVFRGGFQREAALAVAGAQPSMLLALTDKSLIRPTRPGRYDLHDIIRQFAADRLAESDEEEHGTTGQHGRYYLDFVAAREQTLLHGGQVAATAEIVEEIDNVRQAWNWAGSHGQVADLKRAATGLLWFYDYRGWLREGQEAFRQAAAAVQGAAEPGENPADATLAAFFLSCWAWFDGRMGEYTTALQLMRQALRLLPRDETDPLAVYILALIGIATAGQGDFDASLLMLRQALPVLRQAAEDWQVAVCLSQIGVVTFQQGKYAESLPLLHEALDFQRRMNWWRGVSFTLNYLGLAEIALGEYDRAEAALADALALSQENDDRWPEAMTRGHLGLVARLQGDLDRALELFRDSLAAMRDIGDRMTAAEMLNNVAALLAESGGMAEAVQYYRDGQRVASENGLLSIALDSMLGLANVYALGGQTEQAVELVASVLHDTAASAEQRARASSLRASLVTAPPRCDGDAVLDGDQWPVPQAGHPPG